MLAGIMAFDTNVPMRAVLSLSILLLFPSIPVFAKDAALPELGDQTAAISRETEYKVGRAYLRSLRGSVVSVNDPLLQDYVEHLAYRLAFHSPLENPDLTFILIDSTEINAFAVPGGEVGVNTGLFLAAESEAEVAAVLAHELAHVSQRHYARQLADSSQDIWWYLAGIMAGVALAANGKGDAGTATVLSSQAAIAQHQLRYSRQYEQEADRIGMQTLVDAQMDPNAMPRFFDRLLHATQGGLEVPEFLQTHPLTASRVADTAARAAQYPAKFPDDSLEFELMRARVQSRYIADSAEYLSHISASLKEHPDGNSAVLTRFTAANLLIRLKRYAEAEAYIRPLVESEPNRVSYVVTLGECLLGQHKSAQARTLLESQVAISPTSTPLVLLYAESLLQSGDNNRAVSILERQSYHRSDDPNVWRRLADAYLQQKNTLGVFRARGELYYLYGDDNRAMEQIKLGIQAAGTNYPLRARLENRLQEMIAGHNDLKKGG